LKPAGFFAIPTVTLAKAGLIDFGIEFLAKQLLSSISENFTERKFRMGIGA
jgi:hypothetical protein